MRIRSMRTFSLHSRNEKGATLVEGALAAIVFFTLVFAIMQMSVLVCAYLDARNSADNAARTGAIEGSNAGADFAILQKVKSSAYLVPHQQIQRIVVFKATTPDSEAPPECLTSSQTGRCNLYNADDLALPESAFDVASPTPRDSAWPSKSRVVSKSAPTGPDYIGVRVDIKSQDVGGLLTLTKTFSETTVIQLQATSY